MGYIDADKLIEHLKNEIEGCKPPFNGRANGKSVAYGTMLGLKSAISFVETLSTADVVPKSEVEALKDDNKFSQDRRFKEWSEVRQEVAREIFEEIEKETEIGCIMNACAIVSLDALAELKKKYTESEGKG